MYELKNIEEYDENKKNPGFQIAVFICKRFCILCMICLKLIKLTYSNEKPDFKTLIPIE